MQTLVLGIPLLHRAGPGPELVEIERALARLQDLNQSVTKLGARLEHLESDVSFDALDRIEAEVQRIVRECASRERR